MVGYAKTFGEKTSKKLNATVSQGCMNTMNTTKLTSYCALLGCLFMWLSPCYADFATPFVGIHNKPGDVSVTHARVVALGPELDSRFLVIVMNDQMQPVVLWSTAKQGVLNESLLGREIIIKAKVTKAGSATTKPALEILHAERLGIEKIEAEQDDAVQPATASESKAEGKEKSKPDSEGRSQ
jgi:hypothetical protein